MGQLNGAIQFSGTVGNVTVSKTGQVRLKPQSNKAMYASSPSMQRTRENGAEFGLAAKYGKLLRDALRVAIASASDSQVVARVTKAMRAIIALDDMNDRGQRVFDSSNSAPLLGFNFNLGASIGQTMFFPYAVTGAGTDVTMSIPALNPQTDVAAPQGATHFELVFAAAALDMEALTYTNATVAAPLGILPLGSAPLAGKDLVASFAAAPTADALVVGVVGINFYQQVNNKFYPLNNNATNPLAIEYVA